MRTFFKNRPPWFYIVDGIAVELEPRRPIFEKIFSSSRKRGGADAFENDPAFRSKGTAVCMLLLLLLQQQQQLLLLLRTYVRPWLPA